MIISLSLSIFVCLCCCIFLFYSFTFRSHLIFPHSLCPSHFCFLGVSLLPSRTSLCKFISLYALLFLKENARIYHNLHGQALRTRDACTKKTCAWTRYRRWTRLHSGHVWNSVTVNTASRRHHYVCTKTALNRYAPPCKCTSDDKTRTGMKKDWFQQSSPRLLGTPRV